MEDFDTQNLPHSTEVLDRLIAACIALEKNKHFFGTQKEFYTFVDSYVQCLINGFVEAPFIKNGLKRIEMTQQECAKKHISNS